MSATPNGKADWIFELSADKCVVRHSGDQRLIDVRIQAPAGGHSARAPLALALVLDRSGSMSGAKLETAKRATRAVIDQLDERDTAAVVIFDNEIEILQPARRMNHAVKARTAAALAAVQARGSTALHQGWLTGCGEIAGDERPSGTVARCFLLTDGLANVGLVDPEQIAVAAAGVREHAGVGTSTFGIGEDYDESLLGPMAVAGGGQFHHLRSVAEIGTAFAGQLGELFQVAALDARLELQAVPGSELELLSDYWLQPAAGPASWTIALGDLIAGEERHVLLSLSLPAGPEADHCRLQARVVWSEAGASRATPWATLAFQRVDGRAAEAAPVDERVRRLAAQRRADRALQEATRLSRQGNTQAARQTVAAAQAALSHVPADGELREVLEELEAVESQLASAPLPSAMAKETRYRTQLRSRGQRDLRGPGHG